MPITYFIWDEENILAEANDSDTIETVYTNEPEAHGRLISSQTAGSRYYHHFDALGSTRHLTNSAGTVTDTWTYDCWGTIVARTGTTALMLQWLGEHGYYFDSVLSSTYVRRRSLVSMLARWTSVDPVLAMNGRSRFEYVGNRPVELIDPSGLYSIEADSGTCEVTLKWTLSLKLVSCHKDDVDKGYRQNCPGYAYYSPITSTWITRQDWTAQRWSAFKERIGPVIQDCWNKNNFRIKSVAACHCDCWKGGWKPRIQINVVEGEGGDNTVEVAPNFPLDAEGEPSITSWTRRPMAFLDEADLDLWPTVAPYRQITACHEFGHLLGITHPGPAAPGQSGYTGDPSALMGYGMELRAEYYSLWVGKLDAKFPECALHLPE